MSLKGINSRVILKVDTEHKNWHTFGSGQIIRVERQWNNLDQKHTQPVQGIVVHADHIPKGAEVLVHHTTTHPVNEILNYKKVSGEEVASGIKYFSVPEVHCYLWKIQGGEWQPLKGFVIADRVFTPYVGPLLGMPPVQIKNVLYIKSGEYSGHVVNTLRACDYPIIFRNEKGVEEIIIRARHYEDNSDPDREEIMAINDYLTQKVLNGELLIGNSPSEAKRFVFG
jgi:hypothetical protein